MALSPAGHEGFDQLGRVLEIRVHENHGVSLRRVEAGQERGLVAEVPGKMKDSDARVLRRPFVERILRAVTAPVVDEDDLEPFPARLLKKRK